MKRNLLAVILFAICSCNTEERKISELEVVIVDELSYRYDLKNQVYTVNFMDNTSLPVKFKLATEDSIRIVEEYLRLKLYKIERSKEYSDQCHIMPKLYTELYVLENGVRRVLKIDAGCDKYPFNISNEASRVNKFIQFIYDIVHSKPEVKNAPRSDIFYL